MKRSKKFFVATGALVLAISAAFAAKHKATPSLCTTVYYDNVVAGVNHYIPVIDGITGVLYTSQVGSFGNADISAANTKPLYYTPDGTNFDQAWNGLF